MEKHLPTFLLSILTAIALWVGHSISDLNQNVAVVIEKVTAHEKRISKLEDAKSIALTKE